MFLPPRVKTQFPTQENISNDEILPIPIESAFFLEDAQQDPSRVNRYYFDFPGNWITANNGETVIGIRDIWMIKPRRKLEFTFILAKYLKKTYDSYISNYPNKTFNEVIDSFFPKSGTQGGEKAQIKVIIWLASDEVLLEFNEKLYKYIIEYIQSMNLLSSFKQSIDNAVDRDFIIEGGYNEYGFYEKIYSPRNENNDDSYKLCFKITNMNEDFKEVFNIGDGTFQNEPNKYSNEWQKEFSFNYLWDRFPCKIYSSIAEQSNHGYVGNTETFFSPIKYYKLKATDQKFWIEFYSSAHQNLITRLPKHESFCMEMQFLPFDKKLSI